MRLPILLITLFLASGHAGGESLGKTDQGLIQAAFDGNLPKVQFFVEQGASLEATGPKDRSALLWAAANGHTDIVEFLASSGADINANDSNNQTALMFAIKGSHAQTVTYLVENGAEVNAPSKKQGFTALIIAAAVGDTATVRLLLEHGADTAMAERDGNTALDRARQYEHSEIVALLEAVDAPAGRTEPGQS